METAFRVDVYNAAGVRQNGTTINVSDVEIVERASRIGSLSFKLPTIVAFEQGFAFGSRYRLYHETLGYLGEFKHDSEDIGADEKTTTIAALNELWKLNDVLTGFNWAWSNAAVDGVGGALTALMALTGMGINYITGSGTVPLYPFTGTFNGQTVFSAVDAIRKQQRAFFALNAPGYIRFGRFLPSEATAPKAILSNAPIAGNADEASSVIPITSLHVVGEAGGVVNRLVPRGAGSGETQLDLRYSNRTTPYTIASRGNRDGLNVAGANDAGATTRMYYIQDATSIAAYGVVERVISMNEIAPATNSLADRKNAANALYDVATAYLVQFSNPTRNYAIECVNLPGDIRLGDTVRVDYRGVVETADGRRVALRISNQVFFVIELTRKFDGRSTRCALTVSSNGEQESDALDVFTNILRDVDRLKLQPQPTLTYYSRNGGERPVKNGLNYDFYFNLGNEVLELNAMRCVFRTMPLRANAANNTGSGGGTTATSTSGGSSTPTSSSGGGATPTSTSGGSATSSSSSGGGSTPTSTDNSAGHTHAINVRKTPSGSTYSLSIDDGLNLVAPALPSDVQTATAAESSNHKHDVPVLAHTHTMTVPAHTHDVTVPAHTHTVTVPAHTHDVTPPAHTHPLTFGVIEDTLTPQDIQVFLDGVVVLPVRDLNTGSIVPFVNGAGWWEIDILAALLAQTDWHGNHTLQFQHTGASGQGAIFAEIQGLVTIQAIRVAG